MQHILERKWKRQALLVPASAMADRLLAEGIYVIGFSFPVVPKGQARIRTQISAAHTKAELDKAIEAFIRIGKEMNVIEG